MSDDTIFGMLPEIYAPLLPDFFGRPNIKEEKATCDRCAMCDHTGTMEAVVYFRPEIKCCTYHPHLPNYLVGAVFADSDMEEGKKRLRAKIEKRIGVTPRWVAAPKKYNLLFNAARESSFGRSATLQCPYFQTEGGLCSIWKHRDSVCSTFFCKHLGGADGKTFWQSMDAYLRIVEVKLAIHAASTVAPEHGAPPKNPNLTVEELEDKPPPKGDYSSYWGAWEGREEEFYVRCHQVVSALGRDDFNRIVGGPDADEALAHMVGKYDTLTNPKLPERLVFNPDISRHPVNDGVLVTTYSRYEPILLNPELDEVLKEFNAGETVDEVCARIKRDHDLDVPKDILMSLYHLRIIVPPREPEEKPA